MKIVSWNVRRNPESWRILAEMGADVALLQEAAEPPQDVAGRVDVDEASWSTAGTDASRPWRTAVARLSQRVTVEWIEARSLEDATGNDLAVRRSGSLAVAPVPAPEIEPFFAVSMYSLWSRPHASTGSSWILSDASAHRVVSDLSALIGRQSGHSILAAGDLNILHGYGDYGSRYWASRYGTVFDRMGALGLPFVGPRPRAGARRIRARVSCPREARTSRPTTRVARRRRPRHGSWTSPSSRGDLRIP